MDLAQNGGVKGMSLPFEPITMTFSGLHYLVPLPAQQADSPNAVAGPGGQKELELLKVQQNANCVIYCRFLALTLRDPDGYGIPFAFC